MSRKKILDDRKMPKHVALIMDPTSPPAGGFGGARIRLWRLLWLR
jgi:hypothetical protein